MPRSVWRTASVSGSSAARGWKKQKKRIRIAVKEIWNKNYKKKMLQNKFKKKFGCLGRKTPRSVWRTASVSGSSAARGWKKQKKRIRIAVKEIWNKNYKKKMLQNKFKKKFGCLGRKTPRSVWRTASVSGSSAAMEWKKKQKKFRT